jgi:hypothetical protein
MKLDTILPKSSLVPFTVRRVRDPKVLWRNHSSDIILPPLDKVFCIKYQDENESLYLNETRTMYAERYGGDGVGSNGGGARCGYLDGYQIKGVGRNPLAGKDGHFWHTTGACALELAVREVVWGEICNFSLPYGGVRSYAIVEVDSEVPYPSHSGRRNARRTLIFREPKLRPAHFISAPFFAMADEFATRFESEAVRTANAVRCLDFVKDVYASENSFAYCHTLSEFFVEALKRAAHQVAVARMKKIVHGGLSPSNVSLDGGWLDYDTITTVSDFGPLIMGGFDIPHFLDEHTLLIRAFSELYFFISKYETATVVGKRLSDKEIRTLFSEHFEQALAFESAKLTGVPQPALQCLSSRELLRFYKVVEKIFLSGNKRPFYYSPRHTWDLPERFGDHSIANIMPILASGYGECGELSEERISDELNDKSLRAELIAAAAPIYKAYANLYGVSRSSVFFLRFNAQRMNARLRPLYRANLDSAIDVVCQKGSSIGTFVDDTVALASFFLDLNQDAGKISFNGLGLGGTYLTPLSGLQTGGHAIDPNMMRSALADAFTNDVVEQMVSML